MAHNLAQCQTLVKKAVAVGAKVIRAFLTRWDSIESVDKNLLKISWVDRRFSFLKPPTTLHRRALKASRWRDLWSRVNLFWDSEMKPCARDYLLMSAFMSLPRLARRLKTPWSGLTSTGRLRIGIRKSISLTLILRMVQNWKRARKLFLKKIDVFQSFWSCLCLANIRKQKRWSRSWNTSTFWDSNRTSRFRNLFWCKFTKQLSYSYHWISW